MNRIWIAIVLSVSAAGCKQDIGERCQFNEDCASGQCSTAQPQVCVPSNQAGQGDIDATVPIDAPGVGVDGGPDAAPSAGDAGADAP